MVRAYFAPSIARDLEYCFEAEMQVHLAHGLVLVRQGIVVPAHMRNILSVVLELQATGPQVLGIDYTLEGLYSYVERYLVKRRGPEAGGRLHTARSRNDLHTTTWRMVLRAKLVNVLSQLAALRATTLAMAADHADTVMPGYTHSHHAQPITLGYYLLTLSDLVGRDFVRLSAALTTSGFSLDRESTATALGFPALVEVAYAGVSCRDDVHESAAALAILTTNLSRLAFDLQNWNTMEYGFIELADAYSSVSSIMPQKKNPHPLEHTKAAAGYVVGALSTMFACTKNTSLCDVNDGVSAINVAVLEAADRTALVLELVDGVLRTLTVRPEAMLRSAAVGFGTATELADIIVRETGLSFRMAHNIVGRVVSETLHAGKPATAISVDQLEAASQALFGRPLGISPEAVHQALDPMLNVQVHTVTGGPAPANVRKMVALRQEQLRASLIDLQCVRDRLEGSGPSRAARGKAITATTRGDGSGD